MDIQELKTIDIEKIEPSYKNMPTLAELGCRVQSLLKQVEAEQKEKEQEPKKLLRQIKAQYTPLIGKLRQLKSTVGSKLLPIMLGDTSEFLPVEKRKVETQSGIAYVKKSIDISIVDPDKIPKEYLCPDIKKIKQAVKMGIHVDGVEVVEKHTVVFRS